MSEPSCGTLIDGRYRLDRVVGRGAFGIVYEAHHLGLDARVAVKVLRSLGEDDDHAAAMGAFLDEVRTLKRLRHAGIVGALDAGMLDDGMPYFVMEWCDGPTLQFMTAGKPAMTPLAAWSLLEPIFEAMAFAHREGVAHRDLKPSNIVFFDGTPRVIDFGIAKLIAPDEKPGGGETLTTGRSAFTPRYAAPEQIAGARTGPWTDVHALALIFVELVTGRPAIGDDARLAVIDPVRPTPKTFGVDVGAIEPVLARALALRPVDRYPDASAFMNAMREALVPRRSRAWMALLALPVIGVTLAAIHFATPSAANPTPPTASASESAMAITTASAAAPLASVVEIPDASLVATKPSHDASLALPVPTPRATVAASAPPAPTTKPLPKFDVYPGPHGGIGEVRTITAIIAAAPSTKICFSDPTPTELWSVRVIFQWPKSGPRSIESESSRNGTVDTTPTATTLATCVKNKLAMASIPDAIGQDDLDGKPAYARLVIGYLP